MIIARASQDNGDELIILGLSHENIKRLIKGQPIICKRETHGDGIPKGWQISILAGETEQSIYDSFTKAGIVNSTTQIHKDERLGKDGT
jgi:hypothetical protein